MKLNKLLNLQKRYLSHVDITLDIIYYNYFYEIFKGLSVGIIKFEFTRMIL